MGNLWRNWRQIGYGLLKLSRNLTISFAFAGGALAQPLTLVALGDSLTAGYGLNEGEGLVPQLQAWLDEKGAEVTVQNAGVSGDTTAGGLSRLDWALGPDAGALMVILGGNDMMRGIAPSEVRSNLQAIMAVAKARDLPVLVVGMKAPGNWGPDYKAEFDAIYPALGADVFMEDFFEGLLALGANPQDPSSLSKWMQGDGIHPNAEGVKELVKAIGPKVIALTEK